MRRNSRHDGREHENYRNNHIRDLTPEQMIEENPSLVETARHHIAELEIPEHSPNVRKARILQANGLPEWCGNRRVKDLRIQRGRPEHGELRSDDHISRFEALVRFEEIGVDDVPFACEQCGEMYALYRYRAHHHISGGQFVWCSNCEEQYHENTWG